MFKLSLDDFLQESQEITKNRTTIGRHPENEFVINQPGVSDFHCEIQLARNTAYIFDLESEHGTFLNDKCISGRTELKNNDVIRLDKTLIYLKKYEPVNSAQFSSNKNYATTEINPELKDCAWIIQRIDKSHVISTYPINNTSTIGRDFNCDIRITDIGISSKHAKLNLVGNNLIVEDLNSTNGTYVDNKLISTHTLKDQETFKLDNIIFKVIKKNHQNTDNTIITNKLNSNKDKTREIKDKFSEEGSTRIMKKEVKEEIVDKPSWYESSNIGPQGTKLEIPVQQNKTAYTQAINATNNNQPEITGMTEPFVGLKFNLKPGSNKIGRNNDNEIILDTQYISSYHAQILNEGDNWELIDLLSSTGIAINGKQIEKQKLKSGDVITLGNYKFLFSTSNVEREIPPIVAKKSDESPINYKIALASFLISTLLIGIFFFYSNK